MIFLLHFGSKLIFGQLHLFIRKVILAGPNIISSVSLWVQYVMKRGTWYSVMSDITYYMDYFQLLRVLQ